MHNIFGLPETCGIATSTKYKFWAEHSVGTPLCDQIKIKIDDSTKEMLVSGPNVFMGYMGGKDMAKDDYFHTGFEAKADTVNSNTIFNITGRKKSLLITSGGEVFAPAAIKKSFARLRKLSRHLLSVKAVNVSLLSSLSKVLLLIRRVLIIRVAIRTILLSYER